MAIQLLPLPYDKKELEPYISAETLHFHHDKHHKKYVDTTNELIKNTHYENMTLEEIIFESTLAAPRGEHSKQIFNNAAQAWNHNFLWSSMAPRNSSNKLSQNLRLAMEKDFGTIDNFKKQFTKANTELFGSGWTWLVTKSGEALSIITTENAHNPLTEGYRPLLCCDVWEHAYYLDCQNDRAKYTENFLQVINWNFIEKNLEQNNPRARESYSTEAWH